MKNAKKSMFITTILMVAVLIVAVSTATFAWYTATTAATATDATLVAADSKAANVAIGWTDNATTNTIALNSQDGIAPMVPATAVTAGMAYDALAFKTSTIDTYNKFGAVTDATPWTVVNADPAATGFYVINHNVNNEVTVNLTCTIDAAADDNNNGRLVVAIFVDGALAFVETHLSGYKVGDYTYDAGTYTEGTLLKQGALYTGLETSAVGLDKTQATITLKKANETGDSAFIQVKAWFDGQELTQTNAKQSASFSFTVSPATQG